jgi:uncharacterized membrane protein YhaH (DUF805 family)
MDRMRWLSFYFSFHGRVSRKAYVLYLFLPWWFTIVLTLLLSSPLWFDNALLIAYGLLFWPSIAVGTKRYHDRNRSGWFQLLSLIPIVGPLWVNVELAFFPGTKGANSFGAATGR